MNSLAHSIYTRVAPVSDDGDVSECSPYIRQAVERCALPVRVEFVPYFDDFVIFANRSETLAPTSEGATRVYLSAVKELTK